MNKSETNFSRVVEFHEKFNCLIGDFSNPTLLPEHLTKLRLDLIDEERTELQEALDNRDLVEVADALTDMLYVIYGFGASLGINLDNCFKEVHASNMSKLQADGTVKRREDGKILKGENFKEPNLTKAIFSYMK